MKSLKTTEKGIRWFILVFILLVTPLMMAPDADPCPACVIQDFYSALDAGDVETAMTYVAEEAEFWRFDDTAYQGAIEIREQLKREVEIFSYQVDEVEVDGKSVSYRWKMVSDHEVWVGTDTAIVHDGQILYSDLSFDG